MVDGEDGSGGVTPAPREHTTLSTTRRDVIRSIGAGALGAAFAAGASPAAAQMAQGHPEVQPGTPPLQGVRVIERSAVLSGRLAGLLLADQGAEVFVERGATPGGLDDNFFGNFLEYRGNAEQQPHTQYPVYFQSRPHLVRRACGLACAVHDDEVGRSGVGTRARWHCDLTPVVTRQRGHKPNQHQSRK